MRMLGDVSRRDAAEWFRLGQQIGVGLGEQIRTAEIGEPLQRMQEEQVNLITSLPLDAAAEIQRLAQETIAAGDRWEGITPEIQEMLATQALTEIPEGVRSRANTIARTEVSRVQTNLTMVRATHIGSEAFQWMTANDPNVRELHREIAKGRGVTRNPAPGGGVYRWDDLPLLDDNRPGLPGGIYNCRCFASPILPPIED